MDFNLDEPSTLPAAEDLTTEGLPEENLPEEGFNDDFDEFDIGDEIEAEEEDEIKQNVFEILEQEKICYAVCMEFTICSGIFDFTGKDYFIIALKRDYETLQPYKFRMYRCTDEAGRRIDGKPYPLCVYSMTTNDIIYFKSIQNKFRKVVHNRNGRAYELKSKSFKKQYDKEIMKKETVNRQ